MMDFFDTYISVYFFLFFFFFAKPRISIYNNHNIWPFLVEQWWAVLILLFRQNCLCKLFMPRNTQTYCFNTAFIIIYRLPSILLLCCFTSTVNSTVSVSLSKLFLGRLCQSKVCGRTGYRTRYICQVNPIWLKYCWFNVIYVCCTE